MNKTIALMSLIVLVSCTISQGPPGTTGNTGPQGPAGTSCTVTQTNTGETVSCTDGSSATVTNGTNGQNGSNGTSCSIAQNNSGAVISCDNSTAVQITNGTNGTTVSTVQFCSGYTTNYPTTFPEFGICISGSIYAVYWDNTNAWLSEVVPGYYQSTSTSAPCDFTVKANCVVSQ